LTKTTKQYDWQILHSASENVLIIYDHKDTTFSEFASVSCKLLHREKEEDAPPATELILFEGF